MSDQQGGKSHGAQSSDLDGTPDPAEPIDQIADLLDLLADAREDAEEARRQLRVAETQSHRAVAEAAALRREIDGMTSTLVDLDRRLDAATVALAAAEDRMVTLEASSKAELETARGSERHLRLELDRIQQSRTWKITAPLRGRSPTSAPHQAAVDTTSE